MAKELDKKDTPKKKAYISSVCSTRLNQDQAKILDSMASEMGMNRSLYIHKILSDHVEKEFSNQNVTESLLLNIKNKEEMLDKKIEFLTQLFHAFLALFFQSHPKIDGNGSQEHLKESLLRRKKFTETFIDSIYDNMTELYSQLLMESLERKGESENE